MADKPKAAAVCADYCGVPFRVEYVRRIAGTQRDYALIDNKEMGFPLLTGTHTVAEANRTVEPHQ